MGWEVKSHISCQSKHGLMGSSMKRGNFLPRCSQERKMLLLGPKHKNAISDGTSPTCTPNLVYMSAGVFRDQKSSNRIELSWLVLDLLIYRWFQFTLNHLIAYQLANYNWPFGTLPFGQIWTQGTLRHILFWSFFEICHFLVIPGPFEYFSENGWRSNCCTPYQFSWRRRGP